MGLFAGTVKRAVWRQVRSEKNHVSDAKEFSVVAHERCPQVHVKFSSKDEIASHKLFLEKSGEMLSPFTIPGTHKIHFVQTAADKLMLK